VNKKLRTEFTGFVAKRERVAGGKRIGTGFPQLKNCSNLTGSNAVQFYKTTAMSTLLTAAPPKTPVLALTQNEKAFRINSIDLLRGLVMVIMALDHSRDFLHTTAWTDDPLNLQTTTPLLFFTRWITHFCAPVFVFLAGSSIYFQSGRKTKKDLSLFLLKRGLWLLFIEIAIINLAFSFDLTYNTIGLQTIWSIGISMICMAAIIWLPFKAILVLGVLIVLGHNGLDFYEKNHDNNYNPVYLFLHHPGLLHLGASHNILVLYPFLSWVGLMTMGYCFGRLFMQYEGAARRQMLLRLGFGVIAFFIVLRAINIYGNPEHWAPQKNILYTIMSFVDVHKYPPSLLYMCVTIGPALLFLAAAEGAKSGLSKVITVYGRVPFFYYVLHFFLLHAVATVFFFASGHTMTETKDLPLLVPKFIIPGQGYSLAAVYAVWLSVVAFLYPLCKWFSDYKQTHRDWWLSYL